MIWTKIIIMTTRVVKSLNKMFIVFIHILSENVKISKIPKKSQIEIFKMCLNFLRHIFWSKLWGKICWVLLQIEFQHLWPTFATSRFVCIFATRRTYLKKYLEIFCNQIFFQSLRFENYKWKCLIFYKSENIQKAIQ